MLSILEDLVTLAPTGYKFKVGHLPSEGDYMVFYEKMKTKVDTLVEKDKLYSTDVTVYVRQSPYNGVYNKVLADLNNLHTAIADKTHEMLNNKRISRVTDAEIFSIGKDSNGNNLFSLNFNINYYIEE